MISENSHTNIGELEIISDDSVITDVIEFLEKNLIDFPANFLKRLSSSIKITENLISQELEIFLKRRCSPDELFSFKGQWEYSDNSNRKPDIGFWRIVDQNPFGLTTAFFELEAKLLPNGSRDYVKGKYGGIERFKRGHHGKGLPQSAIIGYILEKDCNYWNKKINEWITELDKNNSDITIEWNNQDLLIHLADFTKTKKYNSTNTRIVNSVKDTIILWHYLIELN